LRCLAQAGGQREEAMSATVRALQRALADTVVTAPRFGMLRMRRPG
jgi:hypothetical protein